MGCGASRNTIATITTRGTEWETLRDRIPYGKSAAETKKREDIWKKIDIDKSGTASYPELEKGVIRELELEKFFPKKQVLYPVFVRAYNTAKSFRDTDIAASKLAGGKSSPLDASEREECERLLSVRSRDLEPIQRNNISIMASETDSVAAARADSAAGERSSNKLMSLEVRSLSPSDIRNPPQLAASKTSSPTHFNPTAVQLPRAFVVQQQQQGGGGATSPTSSSVPRNARIGGGVSPRLQHLGGGGVSPRQTPQQFALALPPGYSAYNNNYYDDDTEELHLLKSGVKIVMADLSDSKNRENNMKNSGDFEGSMSNSRNQNANGNSFGERMGGENRHSPAWQQALQNRARSNPNNNSGSGKTSPLPFAASPSRSPANRSLSPTNQNLRNLNNRSVNPGGGGGSGGEREGGATSPVLSMHMQMVVKEKSNFLKREEFRLFLMYIADFMELYFAFEGIDKNGDKKVTITEFIASIPLLEKWGMKFDDADPNVLFNLIDVSGNGTLTFKEFSDWAAKEHMLIA